MLAAVAGLAVGVPPAVAAERSGENGRIAFASDRDGDEDIWLMRPDGSDLVNLTADSEASDFGPSWRTDGRKIAFREDRVGASRQRLGRVDQTALRPTPVTTQENPMKAIIHSRYGPPAALELNDTDTPVITADAVLVRVQAAAVGKGDWLTVQGLPYVARLRYGLPKPKHPVPGFDVAGRIEAVGSNVSQLQPGAAVFGWCEGSFAEYASSPRASWC